MSPANAIGDRDCLSASHARRAALRRAFVTASSLALASTVRSQPRRPPLIAYLDTLTRDGLPATRAAFETRLRTLGWAPGRDVTIEYRFGNSDPALIAAMAEALAALRPDVLVTGSGAGVGPLRQVTTTIPIVCANLADAVGAGHAVTLARPGRNVTGVAASIGTGILGKRLQMLTEFVPSIRKVAVLRVTGEYSSALWDELEIAARSLNVHLAPVDAKAPESFPPAFEAIAAQRADGLCLVGQGGLIQQAQAVCDFALRQKLPGTYALKPFAQRGLLFTYGLNQEANYRRAAEYVDKILRGAQAGELAIEQPMSYEFTINLRTARAIGVRVPPTLLQRADELIE